MKVETTMIFATYKQQSLPRTSKRENDEEENMNLGDVLTWGNLEPIPIRHAKEETTSCTYTRTHPASYIQGTKPKLRMRMRFLAETPW